MKSIQGSRYQSNRVDVCNGLLLQKKRRARRGQTGVRMLQTPVSQDLLQGDAGRSFVFLRGLLDADDGASRE